MRMFTALFPVALATIQLFGCASAGHAPAHDPFSEAHAASASLLSTDEEFSRSLHDREAFAEFISPDAYFLKPDVPRMQGREAFLESRDSMLEMNLSFSPDAARVSAGGDLGFTIGTFNMTVDGPDGQPIERVGKYKTVWQRRDDGRWWIIADTFNFDAPMPAETSHAAGDGRGHH